MVVQHRQVLLRQRLQRGILTGTGLPLKVRSILLMVLKHIARLCGVERGCPNWPASAVPLLCSQHRVWWEVSDSSALQLLGAPHLLGSGLSPSVGRIDALVRIPPCQSRASPARLRPRCRRRFGREGLVGRGKSALWPAQWPASTDPLRLRRQSSSYRSPPRLLLTGIFLRHRPAQFRRVVL
jgi:hypothetical protein